VVPGYPPKLERVVMKALEKVPDARYSDASEMLRALEDAMPGPLEASFETEVATYIHGLFGVRSTERRTAIRVAQEQADRERTDPTGGTAGTMRALGFDEALSGVAFRSRWQRWALPVAAVAVVAACGVITVGSLRKSGESPVSGPAPAGAPGLAPKSLAPLAQTPSVTAARPEPAPEVTPAVADEDAEATREIRKGASPRPSTASRAGGTRRVAGAPAPTATNEATSAPAAAAPPTAAAPPATASPSAAPDAWDRKTFGGRF
jgi:serine/threonine-protein kinase